MARLAPDVAVVTYNADYYLLNLLTTLAQQRAAGEIGAVHVWDNASTDRTADLLAVHRAAHPWLRVHRAPRNVHHGPALDALLRNHCGSEWVLALDADTEIVKPFSGALDALDLRHAAFVGQIQPQMPQLYAYLAHLLVHRPRYLTLPPFCDHGAPGIDYFREADTRGERFVRFRWCDYIHHFGQGSLRRVVEREDRGNKLYAFARSEQAAHPKSPDRLARESQLEQSLERFLEHTPGTVFRETTVIRNRQSEIRNPQSEIRDTPIMARRRHGGGQRRWREMLDHGIAWVRSPRRASWLRAARRLGLVQQPFEAMSLLSLIQSRHPSCVLEIGTAHGGSLLLWARAAAPDALIVSVDLPPWELDDPADVVKRTRIAAVASAHQHVHLLRGNSHEPAVLERVRRVLDGRQVDFLFIDGDHSYDGVTQDFRDYAPLVGPGGIVALHDIHPHSRWWGGEVPRFWREIRQAHRHAEIVASRGQDGFGIGVLWI